MNHRRRKSNVPWFRRRPTWGTVYLMQSVKHPRLIKVGYTRRRTKDRRSELSSMVDGELKIMFTISMPNAHVTEQLVLRGLRQRIMGSGDSRGIEWFWLRRWETTDDVVRRIKQAANQIQILSRLKWSWPKDAKVQIYDPASS